MLEITPESRHQILLVLADCAAKSQLIEWISVLACQGGARVIDGGNQFNVYRIAKHIRRRGANLHTALQNILVARSFSCYQMTEMLKQAAPTSTPLFVLDFLSSYYDEDVRLDESQRLLNKSLTALQQLSSHSAVVIGARPPVHTPERGVLLDATKDIATLLWEPEQDVNQQPQAQLLPWLNDNQ